MLTHSFDKLYQVRFTILLHFAHLPESITIAKSAKTILQRYADDAVGHELPHDVFEYPGSLLTLDYVDAGWPIRSMTGLHVGLNRDTFRL
jgi:hypothetical protein